MSVWVLQQKLLGFNLYQGLKEMETDGSCKKCQDKLSEIVEKRLGFTLGNVVGMYLAQNYDIPNIAKKLEDFKKDVEAKKKPPNDKS
ncbi:Uncharacterized protein C7orf73 [Lonchura striata]|uniref:Uncharacterized protein C7orf73 n=1 Tax=Lonchura striata TaxID=40157 RepID=A0A218V0T5_9PASE|nr:Uncharacterized protein C7orf73 [Lonchura striata domestica]